MILHIEFINHYMCCSTFSLGDLKICMNACMSEDDIFSWNPMKTFVLVGLFVLDFRIVEKISDIKVLQGFQVYACICTVLVFHNALCMFFENPCYEHP